LSGFAGVVDGIVVVETQKLVLGMREVGVVEERGRVEGGRGVFKSAQEWVVDATRRRQLQNNRKSD
jgi:hypothetical protein